MILFLFVNAKTLRHKDAKVVFFYHIGHRSHSWCFVLRVELRVLRSGLSSLWSDVRAFGSRRLFFYHRHIEIIHVRLEFARLQNAFHHVRLEFARLQNAFHHVRLEFARLQDAFHHVRLEFARLQDAFHHVRFGFARLQNAFHHVRLEFARLQDAFHHVRLGFARLAKYLSLL